MLWDFWLEASLMLCFEFLTQKSSIWWGNFLGVYCSWAYFGIWISCRKPRFVAKEAGCITVLVRCRLIFQVWVRVF